jgi:hypothetical protein
MATQCSRLQRTSDEGEEAFIKEKFKKCECSCIIPQPTNERQCCCGKKIEAHSPPVYSKWKKKGPGPQAWEVGTCTLSSATTDAFGKIQFAGRTASESTARYIRLSFETEPDLIVDLIERYWMRGRKKTPRILITVTGGAEVFHMESRLRDAFAKGLSRMTTQSNAWVTTGGQFRGVMKMVGQTLRDVYDDQRNRVPCIGFCQWGFIRDTKDLVNINRKDGENATYHALDRTDETCISLDPNHTHFIIVDDGTEGKEYGEYVLYNKVKKAMKERWSVPIITILLGANDPGPIKNVNETLCNDLPVLIMKGAGGVADLLILALTDWIKRDKSEWQQAIKNYVVNEFGENHGERELFEKETHECMEKFHENFYLKNDKTPRLAIFDAADERDIELGLDSAVLKLLSYHEITGLPVELALDWNRVDILQEVFLFQSIDVNREGTEWGELMRKALLEEKHEFVELFLHHAVIDFKAFLDDRELLNLYNSKKRGFKALKHIYESVKTTKVQYICRSMNLPVSFFFIVRRMFQPTV